MTSKAPTKKKAGDTKEDFGMDVDQGNGIDSFSPPGSQQLEPPESAWAANVGGGLFKAAAGHATTKGADTVNPPRLLVSKDPSRGASMQKSLLSQVQDIVDSVPHIERQHGTPSLGDRPQTPNYWELHSHDGLRLSVSFLRAHLRDLEWMRDRLRDHHRTLIRDRNQTQAVLDAVGRAMYVTSRQDELEDYIEKLDNSRAKDKSETTT